ncbi:WXG100 family type VII secretion target [Streptomyces sp. NPDC018045]|uniref:WXG100 family type VII secretion target n=1 Tax=Streptomyces sp. NPDC018045 TaxID=3365037 RepID=UPI003798C185
MTEQRNPHALHEAAAGWRDMGKHLDGLVRDLDRHVGEAAAANWHGPAGEAFAAEWHQLKRSVDETLPAFELAAADLENAASQDKGAHAGADSGAHDAAPATARDDGAQSSGTQTAYGFMALGQLATSLGGAFRGRGGKGRQGQRPPLTAQWETTGAPQGPDPFGPPQAADVKRARGGAGVAKGVRTGGTAAAGAAAEAPAGKPGSAAPSGAAAPPPGGPGTAPERRAKEAQEAAKEAKGTEEATKDATDGRPGKSPTATASGSQKAAPKSPPDAQGRPGAEEGDAKDPSPDVRRHGAFG